MSASFLTLEPLIDALREAIEAAGWSLSGLQKTTSHQFEGRWEGESTRSAYLFFHRADGPDFASVDGYLDATAPDPEQREAERELRAQSEQMRRELEKTR